MFDLAALGFLQLAAIILGAAIAISFACGLTHRKLVVFAACFVALLGMSLANANRALAKGCPSLLPLVPVVLEHVWGAVDVVSAKPTRIYLRYRKGGKAHPGIMLIAYPEDGTCKVVWRDLKRTEAGYLRKRARA